MEIKNKIICNYAGTVVDMANLINNGCMSLSDSPEESAALIKTIDIYMESIKSQLTILQGELDKYGERG